MNTKNYFRNAAYAAAFAATALFTVGCEDKMTEIEGPLDGISNKNGSTTTTKTAQSVMIEIANFSPSEVVDGVKLKFDFNKAAQYYSSSPSLSEADLAKLMDDESYGKNDKGGPNNQSLKAMMCAFWSRTGLEPFNIVVDRNKKTEITYTLTPISGMEFSKGEAWNNAGSGESPEVSLELNIAGQSIMIGKDGNPKYSFTITDNDQPRVNQLKILLEKLGEDGKWYVENMKEPVYNQDMWVIKGSASNNYLDGFPYSVDHLNQDPETNKSLFGKSEEAKALLIPTGTMGYILQQSEKAVKNIEAYKQSAAAYVDVDEQLFDNLESGQYRIRVTGTIKNNEAAIASEGFSMATGAFDIGWLNSCK